MANNDSNPSTSSDVMRNRRSSFTSNTFNNLFRSNSVSNAPAGTPAIPGPITSAALNDQNRRRRLSISTTAALGFAGASPTSAGVGIPSAFAMRRASMSTASSMSDPTTDENAIEDDDGAPGLGGSAYRTTQTTPYARRVSVGAQAMRNMRAPGGTSPVASANGRQWSSAAAAVSASSSPVLSAPSSPPLRTSLRPTPPASAVAVALSPQSPNIIGSASGRNSFSSLSPTMKASCKASARTASDKVFFPAARADQGYNWSEQLRSRAESTVASGARSSFSFGSGIGNSPPRTGDFPPTSGFGDDMTTGAGAGTGGGVGHHSRAKSVPDVQSRMAVQQQVQKQQAAAAATTRQRQTQRPKPDHFQERILKGDFYMD